MKQSTNELMAELEAVITWFESEEMDIDRATEQFERGMTIARELQERLSETKNSITKLKAKFDQAQDTA